jgi:DNA-binding transcriptional ArsR family regulator
VGGEIPTVLGALITQRDASFPDRMAQIVLDAEAFKALSSDTRLQILKALDARRLTVSELGRLLDLNKATVFEHLKMLLAADLVKKEDEGRKWVYYRLTWKGKNVLHPENVQFMLLLATSVLSIGGLVAQIGHLLAWWGGSRSSDGASAPGPSASPVAAPAAPEGSASDAQTAGGAAPDRMAPGAEPGGPDVSPGPGHFWDDANLWLLGALVLLVLATGVFVWRYAVQRRRERAPMRERIRALPPPEPDAA